MTSFRSLTTDRRPLEELRVRIRKVATAKGTVPSHEIPLHVFEWLDNATGGHEINNLKSTLELTSRCQGTVRVM